MLDRRDFVRSTAAALVGGGFLSTAGAIVAGAADASMLRVIFRWAGGRLVPVPGDDERVGDYALFAHVRAGRIDGAIDVFVREAAPLGAHGPTVLVPLGRQRDLDGAREVIDDHLTRLTSVAVRGGDRLELVR